MYPLPHPNMTVWGENQVPIGHNMTLSKPQEKNKKVADIMNNKQSFISRVLKIMFSTNWIDLAPETSSRTHADISKQLHDRVMERSAVVADKFSSKKENPEQ